MKKATQGSFLSRYWGLALVFALCLFYIIMLIVMPEKMGVENGAWGIYLLDAGRVVGFSVATALTAEILSLPFCIALALAVTMIAPEGIRRLLERVASGLSAIPAVVLGYMSLKFYVPKISSQFAAVVVTLLLMSLMEQTMDFIRINGRETALMERARALGANFRETALVFVYPQVRRNYIVIAANTLIRDLSEGVAILLVVSAYDSGADTLSTAIMKAVGVAGESRNLHWIILLVLLIFLLSESGRAVVSAIKRGGGKHEA